MQTVGSENRRMSREIRQRIMEAMESTSTTPTEEEEVFARGTR